LAQAILAQAHQLLKPSKSHRVGVVVLLG